MNKDFYQITILIFAVAYLIIYAVKGEDYHLVIANVFLAASFVCSYISTNNREGK